MKKRSVQILALIVIGAGIWSLVWLQGVRSLERGVERVVRDGADSGVAATYDRFTGVGYPFAIKGELHNVTVASGRSSYRVARMRVEVGAAGARDIVLSPNGEQVVTIDGNVWRLGTGDASLRVSAPNPAGRMAAFQSRTMLLDDGNQQRAIWIEGLRVDLHSPGDSDTLTGTGSFQIARIGGRDGVLILDRFDIAAEVGATSLIGEPLNWRNAGGAIRVERLEGGLGAGAIALTGDVSLDDALRPQGQLNAVITEPGSLARSLGTAGVIDDRTAQALDGGLTLLAFASGGTLRIPIVLVDGEATIAGIRIARIKALAPSTNDHP